MKHITTSETSSNHAFSSISEQKVITQTEVALQSTEEEVATRLLQGEIHATTVFFTDFFPITSDDITTITHSKTTRQANITIIINTESATTGSSDKKKLPVLQIVGIVCCTVALLVLIIAIIIQRNKNNYESFMKDYLFKSEEIMSKNQMNSQLNNQNDEGIDTDPIEHFELVSYLRKQ